MRDEILHFERSIKAEAHERPAPNPETTVLVLSGYPDFNSETIVRGMEADEVFPNLSRQYGVLSVGTLSFFEKKSVMKRLA